jgi:sortase A
LKLSTKSKKTAADKNAKLVVKAKKTKKKKKELAGTRVKFNFKKHVFPPLVGILVAVSVFGFFNSQLLSAKIEYYLYEKHKNTAMQDSQVVAKPVDKNAPPKIIINSINVNAPVIYDQTTVNEYNFLQALHNGVVHYPNTAFPGQVGNMVIFGHSSGQWWAPGDYKFVFTLLDKVKLNDLIFVEYQGTRYIYRVYNTEVVSPTDLSVLNQGSRNILTLITCTPVGTSTNRLIVRAQQIVPKVGYNVSSTKPAVLPKGAQGKLPSSSSGFWHDLQERL